MELLHLRVLREVARRGSISAAAEALDYTQPAVSRQLAILERQTGHALVDRTPRGARLTSTGEVLLRRAEAILDEVEAAGAELDAIATLRGGRVRMSAFPTAVASFVPRAIHAFAAEHPDVHVDFEIAEPYPARELLRSGAIDVAVTNLGTETEPAAGIVATPLVEDPLFLAAPADHPLAELAVAPLADLAGERWVTSTALVCPDREVVQAACEARGFLPDHRFEIDDYGAVMGLVAAGLGISVVPRLALHHARTDVAIRPLDEPVVRRIVALHREGPDVPARDALIAALRRAASSYDLSLDGVPGALAADGRATEDDGVASPA